MLPGSRFLNAEFDEDEAGRIARQEVEAHERELLQDLVDVVEDARTETVVKGAEFLHAPIWLAGYTYREREYRIVLDAVSGDIVRGDIPPPSGGIGEFLRDAGRGIFRR